jgi:hypothetical protein
MTCIVDNVFIVALPCRVEVKNMWRFVSASAILPRGRVCRMERNLIQFSSINVLQLSFDTPGKEPFGDIITD